MPGNDIEIITDGNNNISIDIEPIINNDVEIEVQTDSPVMESIGTTPLYGPRGPKGDKGDKGDTGNGIESIDKTATVDNVDTYTITYTNGDTTTFDVTNGFNPSYTHNQAVAAAEWTINHNLNKHPTIVVIDSSGNTFYPPVTYDDENTCTIHLLGATTGIAYLS